MACFVVASVDTDAQVCGVVFVFYNEALPSSLQPLRF